VAPSDRSEEAQPKIEVSFPDQNFEGPLDLLLSLIQKHELDILNIPIAFITEKYLEFIRVMQLMNLDLASEYLVMAATLAHIKSKMLLPQVPVDQDGETVTEEEEDPREALIKRLLEYQKYKLAAEQLRERSTYGQDAFFRGAPLADAVDPGLPPLAQVPLFALAEAFQRVLDQTRVKLTHDVVADRMSLTDRIHQLVDFLRGKEQVRFEDLFTGVTTREGLVITFLALLEMSKLRMTRIYQDEPLGPILVELGSVGTSPYEASTEFEGPETKAYREADEAAAAEAEAEAAGIDPLALDDDETELDSDASAETESAAEPAATETASETETETETASETETETETFDEPYEPFADAETEADQTPLEELEAEPEPVADPPVESTEADEADEADEAQPEEEP